MSDTQIHKHELVNAILRGIEIGAIRRATTYLADSSKRPAFYVAGHEIRLARQEIMEAIMEELTPHYTVTRKAKTQRKAT